jgi:hypothetical protein
MALGHPPSFCEGIMYDGKGKEVKNLETPSEV